ncbi:MAG: hypothetical protein PQJ59_16695 [Spirochaetales bacterium]|nr:hypothetical protein [Spirochaetales bacterium]
MIKRIRVLNGDAYYDMKRQGLYTIGKKPKKGDTFNETWVKKSILSRHSHIRCIQVEFEFETTRPVRDQLLRCTHGFVEKYVETSRPDRTGKPRDLNSLSKYLLVFNIEGMIKMFLDRLCCQTEVDTRKLVESIKKEMMNHEDPIIQAIGFMMVPKCIWYAGCNEFQEKDCFCVTKNYTPHIIERIQRYTDNLLQLEMAF